MTLPDPLTKRIQVIAAREGKTPEELLQQLLDEHEQHATSTLDPIEAFIGAFDDDVTDLSLTVRETLYKRLD